MHVSETSNSLASLSIGHLQILLKLLTLQSITGTAEAYNISQPTISRLLRKLRSTFGDPLLVRSGERMVATERGIELRHELANILEQLDLVGAGETEFQPRMLRREFRIACSDSNIVSFIPSAILRITSAGPGLTASFRPVDPAYDIVEALETGELDVVVDTTSVRAEISGVDRLKSTWLYDDEVVLMVRADHPLVDQKPITMDQYFSLQHLAPYPSFRPNPGPIDGALLLQGRARTINAYVPEFNLVPYILVQSDFVFTTCRRFAEHYASFMPIRVLPAPDIFLPVNFRMLWHERSHHSRAGQWLRGVLRDCAINPD